MNPSLKLTKSQILVATGLVISAFLLVGLFLLSRQSNSEVVGDQTERAPLLVQTVIAERTTSIAMPRTFTGILKATRASDLGFDRTGRLDLISVQEGDRVTAGQELASLDTTSLQARLKQLHSQRDAAKALLDELIAGPRDELIESARAVVEDMQSQLQLAQANFQRIKSLAESDAISKQEFDQAKFSLASVEGKLQSAVSQLEELESGTRQEQLSAQQAQVAQIDAAIKTLEVDVAESTMRAPYDAIISQRNADEGSIVSPAMSIVRVVEDGALEVWIGLPQPLCAGLEVTEYDLEIQQQKYVARLKTKLPELDPLTRTQTAIFEVINRQHTLVPGLVARITLSESTDMEGFWVPTRALARGQRGLWSVYVIEEDDSNNSIAKRRDVEVLYTDSDRVLVRGTMSAGDRVIADGTHRVAAGQKIRAANRSTTIDGRAIGSKTTSVKTNRSTNAESERTDRESIDRGKIAEFDESERAK